MGHLLSFFSASPAPAPSPIAGRVVGKYTAAAGSQTVDLDIVALNDELAISLLMTIDESFSFLRTAGAELAQKLQAAAGPIEMVCSAATLGIAVGQLVAISFGLDRQVVLQKTQKIHLQGDRSLSEALSSITTGTPQKLLLDKRHLHLVAGKRVVFVDDVISSGGSCAAALRLLRAAGATVVGVGAILVEGQGWRKQLGEADAALVSNLGTIPLFRPQADGHWVEDCNC